MTQFQKISLVSLRIAMGWLMFYAGIVKILDPEWSAVRYLKNAKTFAAFYGWLSEPNLLSAVNFLNEWGLALIGLALLLGIFVRVSSIAGAVLMVLYYFPVLTFPYIAPHSFIIDDHIIYALVFVLLAALRAGRSYGLENWCANLPICAKFPKLRAWLG